MPRSAAMILWATILVVSWVAINAPTNAPSQSAVARSLRPAGDGHEESNGKRVSSLDEVLELAEVLLQHMQSDVRDYTGVLIKQERIAGKLGESATMQFKIRNPLPDAERGIAAYLKFEEPKAAAGREVIWADGQNAGKLIVHEGGMKRLLGRFELDPLGQLAMMGQKYPITEIGLIRLAEKLIEKGQGSPRMAQARVTIRDDVLVGDRKCRMIQLTHEVPSPEVDFHVAQIAVDMERKIPLRYAAYLWPEEPGGELPVEEEYIYLDVELNVGLVDKDFDPDNPAYDFP